MNREETIAKFQEIMPIVNKWLEYDELRRKSKNRVTELENGIANAKPNTTNLIKNAWTSFIGCFLLGGVLLLPVEWLGMKITFPFYLVYTIILTVILTSILQKRDRKSYEEMQSNLPKVKAEYAEVENGFNREVKAHLPKIYAVIPQNYAYPLIIKKLYSYLVDYRADSLKEAINLYEHEKQQKEQQKIFDAYDKQISDMQRTQSQLEQRVADAEAQASYAYIKSLHEHH